MVVLLAAFVLLTAISLAQAALPDPEIRLLENLLRVTHLPEESLVGGSMRKRDLEFNQYVPAYRLRGEPSCEELRAMWRLSKREARRATSTNQLPRSRPYSYGRLMAFAPSSHQRPFIYGEPRNFAHQHSVSGFSPVKGSFNRLRAMLGGGRPGSFQRLRGMVAAQRLPGESPKGKFDELRGMVLGGKKASARGEVAEISPSLRSSEIYQPVRRTPQTHIGPLQGPQSNRNKGFSGFDSLVGPEATEWQLRPWNPRQGFCEDVKGMNCQVHTNCACAGQYRCNSGKCEVLPAHPDLKAIIEEWISRLPTEKDDPSASNF